MPNETEMRQVFEAGLNQAETRNVDAGGEPFVLVPKETTVLGLEKYLAQPLRKRGKVNLGDVESFVRYVEMHKQNGSRIYADRNPTGVSLVCVLDDHEDGNEDRARAGWKQHTAYYTPRPTNEWLAWLGSNKTPHGQEEFASFLEDMQRTIVQPAGAAVLEVARRLEATKTVLFTSGIRLADGNAELRYEENTVATAGEKGTLEVPTLFKLGLELFEGSPAYEVTARLKYRIKEKQLELWYELVDVHLVVKDAVNELLRTVTEGTGIKPLLGTA
jgi:uncharacterized protein YfdQ (DUF2303 family)